MVAKAGNLAPACALGHHPLSSRRGWTLGTAPSKMLILLAVVLALWFGLTRPSSGTPDALLGSGAMFDAIAPYYDTANKFMSLNLDSSWRRALVDELSLGQFPPDRKLDILDIATGTGDVALMIAGDVVKLGQDLSARTSIIGLDPSSRMLDFAREKATARHGQAGGGPLVRFQRGNAEEAGDLTAQQPSLFDKVTISFGIRNFPDRAKALRNIAKVLKDPAASQVAIVEFVTPRSGPLAPLARAFLVYAVPLLGSLVAGRGHTAEYDHLRDSILSFPTPPQFVEIMENSGLSNCQARNVFMDVVHLFSCRGFHQI